MAGRLTGSGRKRPASAKQLEEALRYVTLGFAVLPLRGKRPAAQLIAFTHGSSSTGRLAEWGADEEQLRFWFSEPDVNVGIFCGEPSGGLVVVDLDYARAWVRTAWR